MWHYYLRYLAGHISIAYTTVCSTNGTAIQRQWFEREWFSYHINCVCPPAAASICNNMQCEVNMISMIVLVVTCNWHFVIIDATYQRDQFLGQSGPIRSSDLRLWLQWFQQIRSLNCHDLKFLIGYTHLLTPNLRPLVKDTHLSELLTSLTYLSAAAINKCIFFIPSRVLLCLICIIMCWISGAKQRV